MFVCVPVEPAVMSHTQVCTIRLNVIKCRHYSCVCGCVFTGLLVYVSMMVGALIWGGLCDKMGRRKCLIYVLAIDLVFSFLSCFAQGYGFFLFFRFCSGFGWDHFTFVFTFPFFKPQTKDTPQAFYTATNNAFSVTFGAQSTPLFVFNCCSSKVRYLTFK